MIEVPQYPYELHPSIPKEKYPKWRPNQKEAVEKTIKAFKEGKRFVIIEAPTGLGKSLMGIAITLLYAKNKTYYTTYTKQLQDQILNDFPQMVKTIKGRNNYQCLQFPELTAENCIKHITKCPYTDQCPYNLAKIEALKSPIIIFNNAYYLTALNYTDNFPKADLVIFDEAHLLENSLMSFVETKLTKKSLDKLHLPFPAPNEDIIRYLLELKDTTAYHISQLSEELKYAVEAEDEESIKDLSNQLNKYKSIYKKAEFLLTNLDSSWTIDYTPIAVTFKPTFVSKFSHLAFQHGEKILLMSATIPRSILNDLGIPKEETEFIELPSPFPVENRPLIFMPKVNMAYRYQEKALPVLISLINQVLDKHQNEKGIIHTSSNKLAEYIYEHCSHKNRILLATGKHKNQALEIHRKSKNTVLISPSLAEGVDFKYDDGRFQIIVNLPFPSLSDKQVKKRAELDKEWYISQMTNKLVQMYGRTNRAEDDYSITYIFDSRLLYYLKKHQNHFPKWFIEAVKIVR